MPDNEVSSPGTGGEGFASWRAGSPFFVPVKELGPEGSGSAGNCRCSGGRGAEEGAGEIAIYWRCPPGACPCRLKWI